MGLKVDKAGRLQSVLGAKDLRGSLRVLAKEILIETGNGYSTRTSADEIIEKVLAGKPEGKEFVKKWNEGLKSSGLSPVSNVSRLHFFRKLDYKGNNGVLRQIVFELNGVDYGKHPTAASALLRLLFERVLMLCIDNTGRHKDYKAWAKSNYRGSDLDMVIKYVIKHESDIFVDSRQVRFVEKIRSAKDNYLDQVLHGASKANTTKVKMYCDEMRDFVEKVLSGQNLRDKNHASNS